MPVVKPQSRPVASAAFIPDDRQREATDHVHGPMLVVAGAGTGKTSVLVNRIVRLVEDGHARPEEILALTYTRNSAAEMSERVRGLLGTSKVHTATFHDYCFDLLKLAGKDFGVLDETDLWIYLRRRLHNLHLEYFVRAANVGEFLKDLLQFVSRCHDELVSPERYEEYVTRLADGHLHVPRVTRSRTTRSRDKIEISDEEVLGRCREIARVFAGTERWLLEGNLGTFSHMITRALALLQNDPNALQQARFSAKFILVDEFQDVNFAQVKVLSMLAGATGNIFAVGDPDQAIYRFRGASSAAFDLFYRQFPTAKHVVLGVNRRSRTPILRCAFAIIEKNPPTFSGGHAHAISYQRRPLESARDADSTLSPGSPVEVLPWASWEAEAADVVQTIRHVQRKLRSRWNDFAILYRTHPNRDAVVREIADAAIPFIIENMDVSDTPEILNLFACLSAVVADGDDVSLFRVAALPQFNIDPESLRAATRALASKSKEDRIAPLSSVICDVPRGANVVAAIAAARDKVDRLRATGRKALEIVAAEFQLDASSPILRAAMNFVETWEAKKINQSTSLAEFLNYMVLFREAGGVIPLESDPNKDAVRLMTAHLAKGLEFPHVFILRAASGSFPLNYRETLVEFPNDLRDPDSAGDGDAKELHKEDERRLFYVAMTRAKDSLHIYGKQGSGKKDPTPPGPIRELLLKCFPPGILVERKTAGSPVELFAEESFDYGESTRLANWIRLRPTESLHLQLSASAIDTYERCPLRFKLERDWRLAAKPAAAMQYGASMHRVLRTYYDSVRAGRPRTEQQVIDEFREDLLRAGIPDEYQRELYEKQGVAQLKEFFVAAQHTAIPEVLHTEEWFEIKFGETRITGRIDRVDRADDGSVIVVDYKTGKARVQEDADESLQLSIYAIAARERWGYEARSLVFYNLAENVPVATARSESDLLMARERVAAVAGKIAAGDFKPNPEYHCAFCSFRTLCPAKEKRFPNLGKPNAKKLTASGTDLSSHSKT